MEKASLEVIAKKMKDLDLCMMITQDGNNEFFSRPMSNNGKVEYDGNSWFFTYDSSNKVKQVKANPSVSLVYQTSKMLFIECVGKASVETDKKLLEEKWVDELDQWFADGVNTPGICLLKVEAERIHYWDKNEEGEYTS